MKNFELNEPEIERLSTKSIEGKGLSGVENLNYESCALLDFILNGRVSKYFNEFSPNRTVCPECAVDDFTHVEGCSISEELDKEIDKI